MSYTLWVEGYGANGDNGNAQCLGAWPGDTFREAVENWKAAKWSDKNWGSFRWGESGPSVWGCTIFDNEADARRYYG